MYPKPGGGALLGEEDVEDEGVLAVAVPGPALVFGGVEEGVADELAVVELGLPAAAAAL